MSTDDISSSELIDENPFSKNYSFEESLNIIKSSINELRKERNIKKNEMLSICPKGWYLEEFACIGGYSKCNSPFVFLWSTENEKITLEKICDVEFSRISKDSVTETPKSSIAVLNDSKTLCPQGFRWDIGLRLCYDLNLNLVETGSWKTVKIEDAKKITERNSFGKLFIYHKYITYLDSIGLNLKNSTRPSQFPKANCHGSGLKKGKWCIYLRPRDLSMKIDKVILPAILSNSQWETLINNVKRSI